MLKALSADTDFRSKARSPHGSGDLREGGPSPRFMAAKGRSGYADWLRMADVCSQYGGACGPHTRARRQSLAVEGTLVQALCSCGRDFEATSRILAEAKQTIHIMEVMACGSYRHEASGLSRRAVRIDPEGASAERGSTLEGRS